MRWSRVKGSAASKLRQRKYKIIRRHGFDGTVLPGSITLTYRRCGKPTCHCATDDGHPMWALSFSLNGKKHMEVISEEMAEKLQPLVDRGREQRDALSELMRLNAQLLRLWLLEQRKKKAQARRRKQLKNLKITRE